VLERINRLLARGRTLEADALAPVAASLQGAVDGAFEDAADDAARRAVKSQWLATVGSGAATLALLSLFGVFYFRSRKAHAIADRLAAENSQLQLQDSQLQVIHRLALAGEYRDDETGHHTRRVGEISRQIGAALEMPERQLDMLRQAAPLHDVGKIAIPDSVLLKPGPLTSEEFAQMKGHAALGAEMLAGRSFPLMEMAELIALTHHERWDGGGYPAGLAGEDIPLVGRIVAVADVFDALTHSRPYKDAWTVEAAVDLVKDQAGRQFDPAVVEAFMTVVAGFARPGEEEAQIDSPAEGRPASAPPAARAAMPW
jgi:putative two-component system response regulator